MECKLKKFNDKVYNVKALISPEWNVNKNHFFIAILWRSFNLARMECKLEYRVSPPALGRALISPEWNVNTDAVTCKEMIRLALISPELNVNKITTVTGKNTIAALISPEWNVNYMTGRKPLLTSVSFNLARMECKRIWYSSLVLRT